MLTFSQFSGQIRVTRWQHWLTHSAEKGRKKKINWTVPTMHLVQAPPTVSSLSEQLLTYSMSLGEGTQVNVSPFLPSCKPRYTSHPPDTITWQATACYDTVVDLVKLNCSTLTLLDSLWRISALWTTSQERSQLHSPYQSTAVTRRTRLWKAEPHEIPRPETNKQSRCAGASTVADACTIIVRNPAELVAAINRHEY